MTPSFKRAWKNVAGAKIWSHYLKKQRNGATIQLPEDLKDSPFNTIMPRPFNFFHLACCCTRFSCIQPIKLHSLALWMVDHICIGKIGKPEELLGAWSCFVIGWNSSRRLKFLLLFATSLPKLAHSNSCLFYCLPCVAGYYSAQN